jgi:hypothetical protein
LKNVCHLLVELSDSGWSSGISAFRSCSRHIQHTATGGYHMPGGKRS